VQEATGLMLRGSAPLEEWETDFSGLAVDRARISKQTSSQTFQHGCAF
jgi:hypothetical protein